MRVAVQGGLRRRPLLSFQGQTYSRCVYIWVDKDFAIGRGLHQGYPKKLGSMWQTRPHPFAHAAPQIGRRRDVRRHPGRRRPSTGRGRRSPFASRSATNGFVNAHKMAHHRVFPGIAAGAADAFAELIESGSSEFEAGPAWPGDADLRLFESPTEELDRLRVDEIIGGYYRQVGVVWNGGRTLATLTDPVVATGLPVDRAGSGQHLRARMTPCPTDIPSPKPRRR